MAKDVNGKELKVGDKVRALTDGWYSGGAVVVGNVYEVTDFSVISDKGVKIGSAKLFMLSKEIELVEEEVKEEANMFKFKVGDKLVLKEEGVTSGTGYDNEQLARLEVYGFIEVMDVGVGALEDGYAVAMQGNYWAVNKLWLSKEDLEDYYVLEQDCRLTPKLIESLDELKVGDYFKDVDGRVHYVVNGEDEDGEVETLSDWLALENLIAMGAYKVKVEPYEMVELEEVKPKPYELVEGQDYVKLERGDIVKFKDGNVHGVHAVDEDDNCNPYSMYFMGDSWWVESHNFLPENIISINGVNIHEEASEKDPSEGWVEGAKVRCIVKGLREYREGEVYTLGYNMFGDFGVATYNGSLHGAVFSEGIINTFGRKTEYEDGTAYKHFELIKE